jgi:hypothetical protein
MDSKLVTFHVFKTDHENMKYSELQPLVNFVYGNFLAKMRGMQM